ncbi:hypothetical protein MMC16_004784 [Acarospora aff. strigata]|nr:hypothetical protein [Acarospora aff. strigata]
MEDSNDGVLKNGELDQDQDIRMETFTNLRLNSQPSNRVDSDSDSDSDEGSLERIINEEDYQKVMKDSNDGVLKNGELDQDQDIEMEHSKNDILHVEVEDVGDQLKENADYLTFRRYNLRQFLNRTNSDEWKVKEMLKKKEAVMRRVYLLVKQKDRKEEKILQQNFDRLFKLSSKYVERKFR